VNSPLNVQLAAIEAELAGLDTDGARERVRRAEAELANTPFGDPQATGAQSPPPRSAPGHYQSDQQLRAAGVVKQAKTELAHMEARAVDLRREAGRVARLLEASALVERAQADVQRAQEAAAASSELLAGARATCERLAKAIEDEKRDAAAAVAASAAAMLEAARTGVDVGTAPVRAERLAPLQAALAGAEAERDRISTRHAANLAAVTAAQGRVRGAQADASEGEYRAAEAAFIALAAQHVGALVRAGRSAPAFIDLHARILAAAQAFSAAS
jgi:hypothetical protein